MIKITEFVLNSSYKLNKKNLMINISKYSTKKNNDNTNNNKNMHFQEEEKKKRLALISAKLNFGQGKRGTELGPQHIKQDFLFNNLENLSNFKIYNFFINVFVNKFKK